MNIKETMKTLVGEDKALEKSTLERMNNTRLVRCLIAMRAKAGLSQSEIAKKMGCTQSRISKMEHGVDSDITIGELFTYSRATGNWFAIEFSNCQNNAAGLIKNHIMQANALLENIVHLAQKDKKMLEGANQFSMEMLLNFCSFLDDATKKIPNSSFQQMLKKAVPQKSDDFGLNCPELADSKTCNS